ncbi:MAG: hypothetical protein LBD97_04155 [Bifidobacteriaceae bacterium]|jgi:hypothetical protein|nr:hypothetical protein [Bifidobacteriaceae bacterium]
MRQRTKTILWCVFVGAATAASRAAWRWQLRWGATSAEQRRNFPGDDVVPLARLQSTRAIGIAAPPRAVWPWLAQAATACQCSRVSRRPLDADAPDADGVGLDALGAAVGPGGHQPGGAGRVAGGGAGLDAPGADAARPQGLAVGDEVEFGDGAALRVVELVPERTLVLAQAGDAPACPFPLADLEFSGSWVLEQEGPTGTRLAVRERYGWSKWRTGVVVTAAMWVRFAVNRCLLLSIRTRAERAWRAEIAARSVNPPAAQPAGRAGVGGGEPSGRGADGGGGDDEAVGIVHGEADAA